MTVSVSFDVIVFQLDVDGTRDMKKGKVYCVRKVLLDGKFA